MSHLGAPRPASPPAQLLAPLPPVLGLRPHLRVLPLGPDGRFVGLDPATAVVVEALPPGLAAMVDRLARPTPVADLVAGAVARGAGRPDALALLDRLHRAGAVVDADAGAAREDRRAAGAVLVHGDGPLTAGVAAGLARAGVGTVHVRTGGTVEPEDLGTGLVEADLGLRRADAVAALVGRVRPGVVTGPVPHRFAADLVVLADALVPEPAVVDRLHGTGTAHLVVRLRDGCGVVGPLVLPGRSACLRCLELHRTARDPTWAGVAVQLVGRSGRADPACAVGTVALATAQAVAVLEGTAHPPVLQATLELDATSGVILPRGWQPHPDCGCGAGRARPAGTST